MPLKIKFKQAYCNFNNSYSTSGCVGVCVSVVVVVAEAPEPLACVVGILVLVIDVEALFIPRNDAPKLEDIVKIFRYV